MQHRAVESSLRAAAPVFHSDCQRVERALHHVQIGVAAHDDADERSVRHRFTLSPALCSLGTLMRTRLTELLQIEHPVMLAGMGGVSYHRLVAAVSEAGGLGTTRDAAEDADPALPVPRLIAAGLLERLDDSTVRLPGRVRSLLRGSVPPDGPPSLRPGPAEAVALRDGIVDSVRVDAGTAAVQAGDAVRAGQAG